MITGDFKKVLLAFGFNHRNEDEHDFWADGCTVRIYPDHGDGDIGDICEVTTPNGMVVALAVRFIGTMDSTGQNGMRDGKPVIEEAK